MGRVGVLADDADLGTLVVFCLEGAGLRTTVTHMHKVLQERGVETAVIDLSLTGGGSPAIHGLDEVRRLRTQFPELRIVALAWREIPRRSIEEAGADAIVTKPFSIDDLVDAVRGPHASK